MQFQFRQQSPKHPKNFSMSNMHEQMLYCSPKTLKQHVFGKWTWGSLIQRGCLHARDLFA